MTVGVALSISTETSEEIYTCRYICVIVYISYEIHKYIKKDKFTLNDN